MDYDFTYTGAEIQAILDTSKKLKDSGYIFLGVATPSTNPGTPTQKVYYEAKQAGTYTNFGGVVLPDGISLLIWNGSWTSETVMCGDGGVFDISVYKSTGGTLATFADLSAALDGGNNIPVGARKGGMSVKFVQSSDNKYVQYMYNSTSTAVADFTNVDNWEKINLEEEVSQLDQKVGDYQGKKDIPHPSILNGAYVRYDNGVEASSGVNSIIRMVDVSALVGKTIYYSRVRIPSSTGNQGVAFYDVNGTYISGKQGVLNASDWELELDSIVVPTGTVKASFTCPTSLLSNFELYALSTISEDLLGKMPLIPIDNVPTEDSDNLVKSGGVYAALYPTFNPTGNTALNACFEELYIEGFQEGYHFSYFTWNGSIITAIIIDSNDNVVLFANEKSATVGKIFSYTQNGVTLYVIFTSSTHSISPQNSTILEDALSLDKNPKIDLWISSLKSIDENLDDEIKASRGLCVSRFDSGNVLPGADHNASWISISRRMDENYDSRLSFANKTHESVTNKFFDFYSIGGVPRGEKYITALSSYIVDGGIGINSLTTSDALMLAVVVGAVHNIDGDNPTMAKWGTGGAHAYGNTSSGPSATMRELSNTVRVDGKLVPIGAIGVRGNVCTIDVINNVQGYNTCKQDGTGREIVQQRYHIEITNDYCDVYTQLVALEDVIVYGSNSITGMNVRDMAGFRFIGSNSKRGFYTFGGSTQSVVPTDNDNEISTLQIENNGYLFETECSLSYGLGNKLMKDAPYNLLVTSAAKAYFQNIKDGSQIELAEGESISWKVRLRVYKK